jgi:tRNA nucleotidyltransferase (CCA-adding enzyme)
MIKLPKFITEIIKTFQKNNFQIYVVGGAVRDLILGKTTNNWDIATNATPEEIQELFPDSFYNNDYGTVTISNIKNQISNKILVEVTPFRKESEYKDNRHPDKIEWAKTIEEDLARRDFTINAIAFDGKTIIDLFEGQKHLQEKLIVAVGNPDTRFKEDGLRLMRALRFASQLGFLIEEKTRISIQKNSQLITNISWERIRDELIKILESNNPAEGILFMKNTRLLGYILPEVELCFMIPQKSPLRHHIYDVGTHLIMALKSCPSSNPITRLAALLHDIGKVKTFRKEEKTQLITFYNHEVVSTKLVIKIADRLRLSNKQKDKLVKLVQYHQFTVSELQTDKAVRRFIRELGKEYIQDMLDLRTADRIGSGSTPTSWRLDLFKKRLIEVQKEPFTVKDLKIDGNDVMKTLKIKPGKQVGEILNKLFDLVVEKKLKNEREILLNGMNVIASETK